MRHLLTLLLFIPFLSSAQVDTILVEGRASQLYSAMSMTGLRNASLANPPTSVNRDNFPVGVILANSRATFYIWRNNCPSTAENSQYMHIGPTGCWQQATNNYLAADWCLVRQGDTFRIDMQCLWDSLNVMYNVQGQLNDLRTKIIADSNYSAQTYQTKTDAAASPANAITNADIQHWQTIYNRWMSVDTGNLVFRNRVYNNPSFIDSLPVSKVTNAASKTYVDAGIATVKGYADNTFQPKGNYLTTPQTLTLSGSTLGITNGNTVTLPRYDTSYLYSLLNAKDPSSTNELQNLSISGQTLSISGGNSVILPQTTTLPYSAITGTPTIPTQTSQLTNNSGFITSAPPTNLGSSVTGQNVTVTSSTGTSTTFAVPTNPYTAGTGISIASNVISTTGLRTLAMPNVTISETALVALSAGVRNVVVACSGVLAGDIVTITPLTAPAGYMVGAAVATANNQLTVQLTAPLLAIGASYSIVCKVAVHRP